MTTTFLLLSKTSRFAPAHCTLICPPSHPVFQLVESTDASPLRWPVQDREAFEVAIQTHGKRFHLVQAGVIDVFCHVPDVTDFDPQYLQHRTVREVIKFYYDWKRTEFYDRFIARGGLYGGDAKSVFAPLLL